ncbi:hypothetical protein Tco_0963762 [Tanacetum coccineum]
MSVRYWALWVLPLVLNKLLIIVAKPTEVANFDALVILGFGQMSQSAGISSPKAVMVMYEGRQRALKAVERIRLAFPAVIYFGLLQTSLQLGSSKLLKGLGIMSDDVSIN